MKRKNVSLLLLIATTFLLSACGKNEMEGELICAEGEVCSETALNAAISEESEDETLIDPQEAEARGSQYRLPPYQAAWGLSKHLYDQAANFYLGRTASISNRRYLTIVDFSQHSSRKRFYLFDLATGGLTRHLVSHGQKSDPNNDGMPTEFSNVQNSLKSSLGFYQTLGTYRGENGYSMRLRGLSATNSNAEKRAIVMHPARYVNEATGRAGRSWGCPALDPKISRSVIDKIKGGSIIFIGR
jgi:hypothetical protein